MIHLRGLRRAADGRWWAAPSAPGQMDRRAEEAIAANADSKKQKKAADKLVEKALAAVKLQKQQDAKQARQDLLQEKRQQLAVEKRQRMRRAAAQAKTDRAKADQQREERRQDQNDLDAINCEKRTPGLGLYHNMSQYQTSHKIRHPIRDDVTIAVTPSVARTEAVQHELRRDWNRKQAKAKAGLNKALVAKYAFEHEKTRVSLAKAAAARRQNLVVSARRMAKAAAGRTC